MVSRRLGILLALFLLGWPGVLGAQEAQRESTAAEEAQSDSVGVEEEEEEKERDPRFVVGFDVGVEVLFTMMRSGDAHPPTAAWVAYATEVDSAFGPFADHPSVQTVKDLLDRGARLEVLLSTLLCHGPPPEFAKEFPYWTPDSSAAGAGEEDRACLLSAVRRFYEDTAFQEFWDVRWEKAEEPGEPEEESGTPGESEEPEEREESEAPADSAGLEDLAPLWTKGLEAVEDTLYVLLHAEMAQEPYQMYYGSRGSATYRIVLTWQSPADTVLATRSAGRELLAWVVPLAPDTLSVLDRARLDRQRAVELGTGVVDPLGGWLWPYLAEYEFLFEYLMRGRGRLGMWDSWGRCFAEHLRRAVHARVLLASQGEEAADAYLDALAEQGYGLIRVLYDNLAEYEANRDRYLSLPDFCPRLISALADVKVEVFSREAALGAVLRPAVSGLVVTEIFEGLAADRAGIVVGDTLKMVDGEPVSPEMDVEGLTRGKGIGGRLEILVKRGNELQEFTLLLGADLINYRFYSGPATGSASTLSSNRKSADRR